MDNLKGEQSPFYKRREWKKVLTKFELYQPAAIDNSLNSYQIIHKLIHEMNLIIDEVNNIDTRANEYTDEQISLLNTQLRAYINELNEITIAHFESVERDILTNKGDIADLKTAMNLISGEFDALRIDVNELITNSIAALKSYVDLQIQIIMELIEAQNPVILDCYGRPNKLQVAYNDLNRHLIKSICNSPSFAAFYTYISTYNHSNVNLTTLNFGDFINTISSIPTTEVYTFATNLSYGIAAKLSLFINHKTFKELIDNGNSELYFLFRLIMGIVPGSQTQERENQVVHIRNTLLVNPSGGQYANLDTRFTYH